MSSKPTHHPWFDVVRGVSALLVCAGHLRAVAMVDFPGITHPALWHPVFYALTGLGHQAVLVFFVLSGFFVGGSVLNQPHFEVRDYAVARLSRLWVVLIPCLLLTCSLDSVTQRLAPSILDGAHQAQWHSGPQAGRYDAGALTFLGNALFLQTVAVPVLGSNSPLWSLASEFWYYVLFPLLAVAAGWAAKGTSAMARAGAAALAMALLFCLPGELVLGFVVWLMGVVAWGCTRFAPAGVLIAAKRLTPLTTLLFVAAVAYSKSSAWQARLGVPADPWLGAMFALWCLSLAGAGPVVSSLIGRLSRRLSDLSYSLYVSHFPWLVLLAACFPEWTGLQPGGQASLVFIVALAMLLAFGWWVWWLFERHTARVRQAATQAWTGLWNSIKA